MTILDALEPVVMTARQLHDFRKTCSREWRGRDDMNGLPYVLRGRETLHELEERFWSWVRAAKKVATFTFCPTASRASAQRMRDMWFKFTYLDLRGYVAAIDSAQAQSQAAYDRLRPSVDILWQQAAHYDSYQRLRQRVDRMERELHQTKGYAVALQPMNPPVPQFGPTVAVDWSRGVHQSGDYPRLSRDSLHMESVPRFFMETFVSDELDILSDYHKKHLLYRLVSRPDAREYISDDDDFVPSADQPSFSKLAGRVERQKQDHSQFQSTVTDFFAVHMNAETSQERDKERHDPMPKKQADALPADKDDGEWTSQEHHPLMADPANQILNFGSLDAWVHTFCGRIVENMGDGRCLYQAVDGALRSTFKGNSLKAGKFARREAHSLKQIACIYLLHYLPHVAADRTINLGDLHARYYGYRDDALLDASKYDEIVAHLHDTMAFAQGDSLPPSHWGGAEEIFGLVWYMREPLFIIGEDAHIQRAEPAMEELRSPHFIAITVETHGGTVLILNVYAPTEQRDREAMFHAIAMTEQPARPTLIGGDFNCTNFPELDRTYQKAAASHRSAALDKWTRRWRMTDAVEPFLPDDQADRMELAMFHASQHTYRYHVGDIPASSRLERCAKSGNGCA
ncbi:hypothetical protein ATCC90586_005542 [Pythium insidiosum]|nr:hypothetical protein ATCC90586_005542 [Pythium insidiosum]